MNWLSKLLGMDEDTLREARIEKYRREMLDADTVPKRLCAWRCMVREIKNRSSKQVARMEREKGLA